MYGEQTERKGTRENVVAFGFCFSGGRQGTDMGEDVGASNFVGGPPTRSSKYSLNRRCSLT